MDVTIPQFPVLANTGPGPDSIILGSMILLCGFLILYICSMLHTILDYPSMLFEKIIHYPILEALSF